VSRIFTHARTFVIALAGVSLLGALFDTGCHRQPPPTAENLVVVTIDTLRADRLGVYGGEVATPNLDRIANAGAFFRHAFSEVPLTRPSHLSIFTGRYPFEHDVPLLAEVLSAKGFRTAGFVSSVVLSSESGLDRGFETFSDDFGEGPEPALFLDSVQKRGDVTMADAVSWLRKRPEGRFFLWVHLYDPHDPYDPPEPYRSRYPGRPYDGEVAFADDLVGRLDRALSELGLAERTLLLVTSDHGEAFEEHGETGHGYFVYDPTLHVPLLARGPGVPAGTALAVPVESVDIFPTVLEMLGISPTALPGNVKASGRSLASSLRGGGEPEPRPLYAESLMAHLLYGWGELASIREGPWKLIRAPKPELYNLDEDPQEKHNRIEENHGAAERLLARLDELAPVGAGESAAPSDSGIDPELMQKLGALGYVGSSRGAGTADAGSDPKDKLTEFRFLSENMRKGLELLQKKTYGASIEHFRAILESGTESFQALYYMGRALYGLGRYAEAVAAFEGALALEGSYGPAYLDLAETEIALGKGEDAVSVLRRGQKALPRSAALHEREGEYWAAIHQPREAVDAFEEVVTRVPGDALARVRLGEQYRDLGEVDEAVEALREAVRLAPDEASYWNSLGMVLGGNDRMKEAEEAFRKARELDPKDAQFAFNLGLALSKLGRRDEAASFFRAALENDPGFDPARRELQRLAGH
jgi:choline-sulfatase